MQCDGAICFFTVTVSLLSLSKCIFLKQYYEKDLKTAIKEKKKTKPLPLCQDYRRDHLLILL